MLQNELNQPDSSKNPVGQWFDFEQGPRIRIGQSFSMTSERAFETHEHIFMEGEPQTNVFLVLSGCVGVYKLLSDGRRQITGFCYPGDMIGLDHPKFHSDSAEALCGTKLRCIPVNAIDKLMLTEPGFGQTLLRAASAELAETRDQLLSLGRKSAMEKLATFMVRISRRNEQAGLDTDTIPLPMKRSDIADYLGLTIETVSRNFTKLRVAQVIRLASNSEIVVLDQQKLEAIAEGSDG